MTIWAIQGYASGSELAFQLELFTAQYIPIVHLVCIVYGSMVFG